MIEILSVENNTKLTSKNQEIDDLQKRIDSLVLKIVCIQSLSLSYLTSSILQDANKDEIFNLQESNQILQTRINDMNQKTVEDFPGSITFSIKIIFRLNIMKQKFKRVKLKLIFEIKKMKN
jgi:hypothetical protein